MKSRKREKEMRALCGQLHPDDGVDPREFHDRTRSSRRREDHKLLSLCKQVFRSVSCTLAGECGDAILQDLSVVAIEPKPDATHLLVLVQLTTLKGQVSLDEVRLRLSQVRPFLREQVATAVSRRRAPDLSFQVILGTEASE